ncbi:M48 family metallopeptidase [Phreatobacter stygius]|uniref:M48 family metallopeptidase n=2 Tax=Phreatobacter stygius TaxID=1940610 RepID=A0A4D7B7G5_9HYPH|nr:M48 family metallopeptidase [Phreatobacter stygius]
MEVEAATRAYLDTLQGTARATSDAYFEGGYWLLIWGTLVTLLAKWLMLRTGLSARFRDWAERATPRRWLVPALYAAPYAVASALIVFPWSFYTGFVREKRYDLMSQSLAGWLGQQAIGLGIAVAVGALLMTVIFAVIRRAPRRWWLWGAAALALFTSLGTLIAPVFIAPLFNTYAELPAGPVRDRIVAMARASHVPAAHIYLFDQSRQDKRISANVSGLGPTIRISLNDNLLNQASEAETAAVMAHELGHYVLGHAWQLIGLLALVFLAGFWLLYRLAPAILARWGGTWGVRDVGDPAVAPLFSALAVVFFLVMMPVMNTLVRAQESQADLFGLATACEPDGFASIAMKLSDYRKIEPGRIEEFLFFDHPSGATRVRMAMQWKADNRVRPATCSPLR